MHISVVFAVSGEVFRVSPLSQAEVNAFCQYFPVAPFFKSRMGGLEHGKRPPLPPSTATRCSESCLLALYRPRIHTEGFLCVVAPLSLSRFKRRSRSREGVFDFIPWSGDPYSKRTATPTKIMVYVWSVIKTKKKGEEKVLNHSCSERATPEWHSAWS